MKRFHFNMRRVQGVSLFAGILLFGYLVHRVGVESLLAHLALIGWGIVPFLLLHAIKEAFATSAWDVILKGNCGALSWINLYLINSVGAAVNKVIPSATVGGDAVKVMFLRERISTTESIASVIICKLTQIIAQILFVLSGLFFVFDRLDLPPGWNLSALAAFLLLMVLVFIFLLLQRRGLVTSLIGILERLGMGTSLFRELKLKAASLDDTISRFHSSERLRFLLSILFHGLKELLNLFQVYLVLWLLGLEPPWLSCFVLSVASVLVNTLFFFIPLRMGAQEGGKVLVAAALGYTTAQGLTLAVVSRLNQIVWTFIGLMVFFALHLSRKRLNASIREAPSFKTFRL